MSRGALLTTVRMRIQRMTADERLQQELREPQGGDGFALRFPRFREDPSKSARNSCDRIRHHGSGLNDAKLLAQLTMAQDEVVLVSGRCFREDGPKVASDDTRPSPGNIR